MSGNQGYSITTWRLRLRCKHPEWLQRTQNFYNQVIHFYYELFLEHRELSGLSRQKALRELEILSVPGRDKKTPPKPLPWNKVPLYFRRSAINAGVAAAKSYASREENTYGRKTQAFSAAVVYYKGMYRDFSSGEISLKVWDGERWTWMRCRLYGREFPENAQIMSPSVVFEDEFIMLHVPIKEITPDVSSVKERMEKERNVCGIQFTNTDAFAVGSVTDGKGRELAVRFFKGGKEYSHYCRQVLEKIEKSEKSLGDVKTGNPNKKYWMHLKHLNEYYAHKASRELLSFCQEKGVGVIALPKYKDEYSRYVMCGSGNWSPIHLSTRIREYLTYKAWKAGILVIEVNARGIGSTCAVCGKKVTYLDKKKDEYLCEDGHRGNRFLNSARNLGRKCLIQFGKQVG